MPYTRLIANGTTPITTNYTKLNKIIIGKKGAASNTMTIWNGDPSSGQLLITIDTTTNVGFIDFGGTNGGLDLSQGLNVVLATGTAPEALIIWNE